MERLTKRDTDGQAMMDCQKCEAIGWVSMVSRWLTALHCIAAIVC